jgi:hypothetical protein
MKYCVGVECENLNNRVINLCCHDCKIKDTCMNESKYEICFFRDGEKDYCEFYQETAKKIRFKKG